MNWAKVLRTVSVGAVAIGATAFVASFPILAKFQTDSEVYQLVKRTPDSELFGEVGEPIGSPQRLVVDAPGAVLPETTPDGVKLLDDAVLREQGVYPLQLQTVEAVVGYVRIGSGAALAAGLVGLLLSRRRAGLEPNPEP